MSRVIVDLESLRVRNCGLGQFALSLGKALLAEQSPDLRYTFFLRPRERQWFAGDDVEFALARPWRREAVCKKLRPLARHFAASERDAVWHMMNQSAQYWPIDPRTPMVLTIHDLNFLRERDEQEIPRELAKLQAKVDRAAIIATVSKFVEREIRQYLAVRGKEIAVVYNGATLATSDAASRPGFLPRRPFLFTIGEINPKKNFHVLLDLVECLPDRSLVIAGNKSSEYAQRIESEIQARTLAGRVFLPGQISGGQRLWLYENCEAFVFPSKTEGFGLPVIEAMSAGRPVFLSHATSLPEVGGPLGFYWHAYDTEHLLSVFRAGMQRVAQTPDFGEQVRRHAAQFTWSRAARQYADLYRRAAAAQAKKPLRIAA